MIGKNVSGGIIGGFGQGDVNIKNCFNYGELTGIRECGGIVGYCLGGDYNALIHLNIFNSANVGNMNSPKTSGGIVGVQGRTVKEDFITVENTYNIGKLTGSYVGNIIGEIEIPLTGSEMRTMATNAYYVEGNPIGKGSLTSGSGTLKTKNEICSQAFVDLLNQNIGSNSDWRKWKIGGNGYPEFDN